MGKIKTGRKAVGGFPLGRMVASQLRHPGVMVPLTGTGAVWGWGETRGWLWPIVAGTIFAGVLATLAIVRPDSFRRQVWWRVKAWYRRYFTYAPRWWFWMGRVGLSITDEMTGWIVRPRILKVRSTGCVDSLLLDLPLGIIPKDFIEQAERLRHAAKARRVTVREEDPGTVWVDLYTADPLKKPIPAVPVPSTLRIQDLDGLVVGYCEDGTPWRLKVSGTHVLVVGRTGSGKSSLIWSALRALGPYIRAGLVVVHAIDPKGGMELEFGRDLFERYECDDYEAMVQMLEADADYLDERAKALRGKARKFTASRETPFVFIVIDELMQLTALLSGPDARRQMMRVETALGRLLSKGRGPGYGVLATAIEPTKDVVTWRDMFPDKVAFALGSEVQVDMVLGEGMRDLGAEADLIPASTPGVGYIKIESSREPVRVRAAYVTDDEIVAMAAEYKPLGSVEAGDGLELADADTVTGEVLDDDPLSPEELAELAKLVGTGDRS